MNARFKTNILHQFLDIPLGEEHIDYCNIGPEFTFQIAFTELMT